MDKINTSEINTQGARVPTSPRGFTTNPAAISPLTDQQLVERANATPAPKTMVDSQAWVQANKIDQPTTWGSAVEQGSLIYQLNELANKEDMAQYAEANFNMYSNPDQIAGFEDYHDQLIKARSPQELEYIKFKIAKEIRSSQEAGFWPTLGVSAAEAVATSVLTLGVGSAAAWGKTALTAVKTAKNLEALTPSAASIELMGQRGYSVIRAADKTSGRYRYSVKGGELASEVITPATLNIPKLATGVVADVEGTSMIDKGVNTFKNLNTAGQLAIVNAAQGAAEEAIYQQNNYTRSLTDSAINVAGGAVIGGAIGAGVDVWRRSNFKGVQPSIDAAALNGLIETQKSLGIKIDETLIDGLNQANTILPRVDLPTEVGSAMKVKNWTPEDTKLSGFSLAAHLSVGSPSTRLLLSDNAITRKFTNDLVEHNMELAGHNKGLTTVPVETTIARQTVVAKDEINNAIAEAFNVLRKTEATSSAKIESRIWNAILSNVADSPVIQSAANRIKKVLDDINQNFNVAANGSRKAFKFVDNELFNKVKIRNSELEFKADIANKLKPYINELIAQNKTDQLDTALEKTFKSRGNRVDDYADAWASQIYNDILADRNINTLSTKSIKGVKDSKVEIDSPLTSKDFLDYYDTDLRSAADRFIDKTIPKTELINKFGSYSNEEILQLVRDEATKLKAANPNNATDIEKQLQKDLNGLSYMLDNLKNTPKYGPVSGLDTFTDNALRLSQSSKLLSAVLSNITDVSKLIMIDGLKGVGSIIQRLIPKSDFDKLSNNELKQMSRMMEDIQNNRSMSIASVIDRDSSTEGTFTKVVKFVSNKGMELSLLPAWTKTLKVQAGYIAYDKFINAGNKLLRGGNLNQKEIRDFAKVGLDSNTLKLFAEQHAKHKSTFSQWDQNLVPTMHEALIRTVDKVIVTPKIGDMDKFLKEHPIGRMMFQFQNFAIVNWNQFLVSGIQRPDANLLMAAAALLGVGYIQEQVKAKLNGNEFPEKFEGNDGWGMKVIDASGLASLPLLAWDKASYLFPGWDRNAILGSDKTSREKSSGERVGEMALGPVGGYLASGLSAADKITNPDKEFDTRGIREVRQLLPLQNLWYMKGLFNYLEEKLGNELSLPGNLEPRRDVVSEYLRKIGD